MPEPSRVVTYESYHGDDPLKQMRSIAAFSRLTDEQCIDLHKEMKGRELKSDGSCRGNERVYQMIKWVIERSKEMF